MRYIDEKFKDSDPRDTVEKIIGLLKKVGIETEEKWHESGVENCFSLTVSANGGIPSSNGKGVTEELARASAYGEFIERLQGGLFFYKFQSLVREESMNIHAFAPDAKYMTVEELFENAEWVDLVVESCNSPSVDRDTVAEYCKVYSLSSDGRILAVPFYSIFEKRSVYLPINFVDQIYATNGCCVGNTKEEAWVHALSEMMERHASLKMLKSGGSAPKIPDEKIQQFPVVSKIINDIRKSGEFDVDIFDYSIGNGFPVVSTRIINKQNQNYRVNVAADPVFEIALQRTLTELMQGKNIHNFTAGHGGKILNKVSDFSVASNVLNQLETGNGMHTVDFFANELTCDRKPCEFADNSNKNNKELLGYMLGLYKQLNRPVYVRNFSYLGFPCYRFVVPGFSEALSVKLCEPIPEYAVADEAATTMRNPKAADEFALSMLLNHSKMIRNHFGRYLHFNRISGVPLTFKHNVLLSNVTRAYAAYRLGQFEDAKKYMKPYFDSSYSEETLVHYFKVVDQYLEFKQNKVPDEKIRVVLNKFFDAASVKRLYDALDSGKTPYDEFLLECDYKSCENCRYREDCLFKKCRSMNAAAGEVYKTFIHGQYFSEFKI